MTAPRGFLWVRLETSFPQNPKILTLVGDKAFQAITVYVCSLSYSGAQGTDGFVPRAALPYLHARKSDVTRLVDVGLWVECAGGWTIHGWHDYQPSSTDAINRRVRAQTAAAARWSKAEVRKLARAEDG